MVGYIKFMLFYATRRGFTYKHTYIIVHMTKTFTTYIYFYIDCPCFVGRYACDYVLTTIDQ